MVSEYNVMLISILLAFIALVLSSVAIYYYYKGNKLLMKGKFTKHAKWMFYGVIFYAIHLIAHILYLLIEIGILDKDLETIVNLSLYAFLAFAGIFFIIAAYYYFEIGKSYGFKK